MTEKPLSRFPVPELEDMPDDIRDQIVAMQAQAGFVPNVFRVLAHRPDEFRAFMAYYHALMDKDGGLTKAEREMIVVTTSAANSCLYCVVAHGAILRIRAKDPLLADQVAVNYRHADITPRQRTMLDFALKVSQHGQTLGEADFAELRDAGFDEDDSWDIGAIAALFALSNRMAFLTGMWPNTEFYAMGRQPLSAPLSTKGATGVQGGKTKPAEPAKKMGKRKKGETAKGRGKKTTA